MSPLSCKPNTRRLALPGVVLPSSVVLSPRLRRRRLVLRAMRSLWFVMRRLGRGSTRLRSSPSLTPLRLVMRMG